MLAGLFKAPTRFAPHANLPAARARANDVLSNMVEAGMLTQGEVLAARRNPATPVERRRDTTADYYLDWAFTEAKRLVDQGRFGDERVVTIKTALDLNMQRRSESAVEMILRQHGNDYEVESGAAVLMDVDGAMRAMVGGRDYGQSQFNRATDAQRAPGSSFKPFVYAAALETGKFNRNSTVVDRPVCIGNWCPQNYGRSYAGSLPLTTAVAKSINTTPVQMTLAIGRDQHPTHDGRAARAGRDRIVQLLRRMGVQSELKDTPSMSIGSVELTVVEMAQGYAAFARHGLKVEPYAAVEARNSRGDVIYRRDRDAPPPEQILSRQVAEDMNYLLSKVPEEGTGRRAALPGIRTAGKTGTTDAYRNAWYVGYSGNFAAAVWLGNDDYSPTSNMTGGSLPAMIWHEIMSYAHQGVEIRPIPGLQPLEKPAQPAPAAQNRPAGFEILNPAPASRLTQRGAAALTALDDQLKPEPSRRAGQIRELQPAGDAAMRLVRTGQGRPEPR
jgi:penicillin-binding protein 1A